MTPKSKQRVRPATQRVALLGILGAMALVLAFLENQIPAVPGLPPGAKLGLANIVTMFAAYTMGFGSAMTITVIKALFAGTRGLTAFFMSLSGGILSTLIMCALIRIRNNPFGILGVSIASAVGFNAGQLLVACIMSGTPALLAGYGPLLLLFAILTGALTGTVLRLVLPALEKQAVRFLPDSFRKRTGRGHGKSSS